MEEKSSTTRTQRIMIWVIAVMMIIGSVGFYFLLIMQNNQMADEQKSAQEQLAEQKPKPILGYEPEPFDKNSVTKLKVETLKEGSGKVVKKDDFIKAQYMGWLPSGELFDSSSVGDKSEPVSFGLGNTIPGWQEGVSGMKEGEVRKLIIPSELAYGSQGIQGIPPDTPLAFIVKVVEITQE